MESNYLIYDRLAGPMVKKTFLRRMLDRVAGVDDWDFHGAIGYLFERQHTGEYIPIDKIKMLLGGSIGTTAVTQVLGCLFCDEEDLPDMILEDPRSVQAEIARARLGMPKPPPEHKITMTNPGRGVGHVSPAIYNTSVMGQRRDPPEATKIPARRAQALADKYKSKTVL